MAAMLEALIDSVVDRLPSHVSMVSAAALSHAHLKDSVVDYLQLARLPQFSLLHALININQLQTNKSRISKGQQFISSPCNQSSEGVFELFKLCKIGGIGFLIDEIEELVGTPVEFFELFVQLTLNFSAFGAEKAVVFVEEVSDPANQPHLLHIHIGAQRAHFFVEFCQRLGVQGGTGFLEGGISVQLRKICFGSVEKLWVGLAGIAFEEQRLIELKVLAVSAHFYCWKLNFHKYCSQQIYYSFYIHTKTFKQITISKQEKINYWSKLKSSSQNQKSNKWQTYFAYVTQAAQQLMYSSRLGQQGKHESLAKTVVMIRPFAFKSNEMTISNNYYQQLSEANQEQAINAAAIQEFDTLVAKLTSAGVQVIVTQDKGEHYTPDSVFPNNWVSFHAANFILYPMFAPNRRLERKIDIFASLASHGIQRSLIRDYSSKENEEIFLEGTGSMVLDRKNMVAFAAISPRTNEQLFHQFCSDNDFKGCSFRAYQTVAGKRQPIYHTNVMMWIGDGVAAVCLQCIDDPKEREKVAADLGLEREIIQLSEEQVANFAGNCLMLQGQSTPVIAMSDLAYSVYTNVQRSVLEKYGRIISSDVSTIEKYGGGSVRCMLAEVF